MPLQAPMMVRNTQKGPLVFSPDGDANNYIEFQGAGDPEGRDLQIMPGEMANNVQFRRNLNLGLLTVEENNIDIDSALAGQRAGWEQRQAGMTASAMESIEHAADNDILMKECIGPGTRAGENCGASIPQRADAVAVHPPLCQAHNHLAGQFRSQRTGRISGNQDEVVWVRGGSTPDPSTTS